MSPLQSFPVGSVVGAHRWPYSHAHPDCWATPLRGIVLAINDPRAWEDTLAFVGLPTQGEVDAHVARCLAEGWLDDRVPVEWEGKVIHWESPTRLRAYDDDVREWEQQRAQACLMVSM